MTRRLVLAALAEGIAAGSDDAARAAIGRTEWLLRRRARRRLERVLIDAALAADEPGSFHDPEAARHVHRVAALGLARVAVDPRDRTRVADAYAALPAVTPPRWPLGAITAALAIAALAVGAVFAIRALIAPRAPAPRVVDSYVRPLPPPAAGAFRHGGVPLRDPAIEALLSGAFTDLVVRAPRGMVAVLHTARAVAEDPAIAARGPALTRAWGELVSMIARAPEVPEAEQARFGRVLIGQGRAVSDQLAALGIGLYVEAMLRGTVDDPFALVHCYRVEQVVYVRAAGEPRRVLSLRRIDELNRSWAMLGMQSDELGDPVVLLDKVDEHVASTVLPVLAPDAAFPLGDPAWRDVGGLGATVGEVARRELLAVLAGDAPRAQQIGAVIAARGRLVDGWRERLDASGWRLPRLEVLYLPEETLASLDGQVPGAELARARDLDARLVGLDAGRIAARVHDVIAASVRRHEAQHGVDADRAAPLRYPAALEALLGRATAGGGEPRRSVERARAELSAYLSQVINDPVTPQLSLWHLARAAFDRRQWGSAESYAAVVLVEGLARQLGEPAGGPAVHDGGATRGGDPAGFAGGAGARPRGIDRAVISGLGARIARASEDRLRAAARALWTELYDEPPAEIVDLPAP